MLPIGRRTSSFTPPPTPFERQLVPVLATMVASLLPIVPIIVVEPILPPLGLLVFLGWRLRRPDIWPLWAGLPLGAWDDAFSGQPIGSAVFAWTALLLAIDAVDRRLPWRDHRQDWGIAALGIAACLLVALLLVRIVGGATTPMALLPQWLGSALLMPLIFRACAALDRWRGGGR